MKNKNMNKILKFNILLSEKAQLLTEQSSKGP